MLTAKKFTVECPDYGAVHLAAFDHADTHFRVRCSECKRVINETEKPLTVRSLLEVLAAPDDE